MITWKITYETQLEGFTTFYKINMVCKKKRSLYGMKQTSKHWYLEFDNFMKRSRYTACGIDRYFYLINFSLSYIILILNSDNILIDGSGLKKISALKPKGYWAEESPYYRELLNTFSSSYINLMMNIGDVLIDGCDMKKICMLKMQLSKKFKMVNLEVVRLKKVLNKKNYWDEESP